MRCSNKPKPWNDENPNAPTHANPQTVDRAPKGRQRRREMPRKEQPSTVLAVLKTHTQTHKHTHSQRAHKKGTQKIRVYKHAPTDE